MKTGRDWVTRPQAQASPKPPAGSEKRSSPRAFGGSGLAATLISDVWPPELRENNFHLKRLSLW